MTSVKPFGIIVEARGEGPRLCAAIAEITVIAGVARDRKSKPHHLISTDDTDWGINPGIDPGLNGINPLES
jgi:hypothetical protein